MSYMADVVVLGGKDVGYEFCYENIGRGILLKKISVWVTELQLKAIQLWLSDGSCDVPYGKPEGNSIDFSFDDGENFTSLSLWENQKGSGLGAIKFKTSQSREFYASCRSKKLKKEVPVDVASGICIGIKGRFDENLICLGFMFINTIKSTKLTDVVYPTLNKEIPKVNAREIKSMTYENKTSQTQEYKIETSKKIIQKNSWSVSGKLEVTFRLEVNAGIPLVVAGKTRYELKLGLEGTYASETSEEKMELYSFPVKVHPGKTVDVDITLGEAKVDLPFNGKIKITCHNGGVLEFKTSGTYKGVSYTGGNVVVNESTKILK